MDKRYERSVEGPSTPKRLLVSEDIRGPSRTVEDAGLVEYYHSREFDDNRFLIPPGRAFEVRRMKRKDYLGLGLSTACLRAHGCELLTAQG